MIIQTYEKEEWDKMEAEIVASANVLASLMRRITMLEKHIKELEQAIKLADKAVGMSEGIGLIDYMEHMPIDNIEVYRDIIKSVLKEVKSDVVS